MKGNLSPQILYVLVFSRHQTLTLKYQPRTPRVIQGRPYLCQRGARKLWCDCINELNVDVSIMMLQAVNDHLCTRYTGSLAHVSVGKCYLETIDYGCLHLYSRLIIHETARERDE